MVSCEFCGEATGELAFECNYCGCSFCESHRLPESHDCSKIAAARPPTSATDEADAFLNQSRGAEAADNIDLGDLRDRAKNESQPYSVVNVDQTVGTAPDSDFDSSPDVAVDGSIATENESSDGAGEAQDDKPGNWVALLLIAFVVFGILVGIVVL